ncbi:helix-turn-helix transcriptional regulator [Panacagrimonas sp.]|uniref:helix-turn-helix transcriptional regulator n=1 Tax=Panacagrimonas sp. TaxID=2480088 RepID=UPI003B521E1E
MSQKVTAESLPESCRYFDTMPDAGEVRQPTVEALFGISAATVWRWVREGRLPKPRKRGPRVTTWNVGELRAVLSAKAA